MVTGVPYPVRVDATLQPRLSRWLWLVKWFLAIPHFVVLIFLWIAFAILSVVAFFSILITARYPRSIFEFNVGVLRWHWRVAYYSFAAFGTDRYPPFTLAEVPDYPAHLEIAYPQRLSRGLVLVKWWLLAIPHYIVTGLFIGGGTWFAWRSDNESLSWGGGLVGILALVAVVVLAFTGRYPKSIFDFVLGMDRWVLRVAAYAGLMTDRYPPFRLDMGGNEPTGTLAVPAPSGGVEPGSPAEPPAEGPVALPGKGWTAGRVIAVVAGSVLGLVSLGALGGGGALLWADQTQREDGYLTTNTVTYRTDSYALAADRTEFSSSWRESSVLGDVRIRVTAADSAKPVFVGIARADAATAYLSGVRYTTVTELNGNADQYVEHNGVAPPTPPAGAGIWVAQATGAGAQTLTWHVRDGEWMVVVMNADASAGLDIRANAGATVPGLTWLATGLLAGGVLLLVASVLLIAIPIGRASRQRS
jgi:Domain of unknown function (DUF4389)